MRYVLAILCTALVLFLGANQGARVLVRLADAGSAEPDIARYNDIIMERFARTPDAWKTILVGSSATSIIPPHGLWPEHSFTMGLQGGTAATGLAAIVKSGAHPERVFIEADFLLLRDIDYDLINRKLNWPSRTCYLYFPILGDEHNLFEIFKRYIAGDLAELHSISVDSFFQKQPNTKPWEIHRHEIEKHIKHIVPGQTKNCGQQRIIRPVDEIADLISTLKSRGTNIIFYMLPLHPLLIRGDTYYSCQRRLLVRKFSKYPWAEFSHKGYATRDGIHATLRSGYDIYKKLMTLDTLGNGMTVFSENPLQSNLLPAPPWDHSQFRLDLVRLAGRTPAADPENASVRMEEETSPGRHRVELLLAPPLLPNTLTPGRPYAFSIEIKLHGRSQFMLEMRDMADAFDPSRHAYARRKFNLSDPDGDMFEHLPDGWARAEISVPLTEPRAVVAISLLDQGSEQYTGDGTSGMELRNAVFYDAGY